ncbi:LAFA_0C08988g1_1 [Lachancea sp. 'fantastica']|nr:LAFA_0C08988g1_1 [Lachancea sp. 'fantastica']
MAPCLFMAQVAPGTVLPVRIFINRKQFAKNVQDSRTSFETPILSNNSIIRLKSPLVRLYLSNIDARNLCGEIKDELLLILYELAAQEILDSIMGKLKIDNLVEFKDIIDKFPSFKSAFHSDAASCGLVTLERISRFQYKMRYEKNWTLDIFVNDIRKLTRIRETLLARLLPGSAVQSFGDSRSMKILRRTRHQVPTPPQVSSTETTTTTAQDPLILQESDDDGVGIPEDTLEVVSPETIQEEKKPQFVYRHSPLLNLGNCIDIHVLKRPKRVHKTR